MEQPTTASLIQGGAFCEHCGRTFSEVFTQIAEKSIRTEITLPKHKRFVPVI